MSNLDARLRERIDALDNAEWTEEQKPFKALHAVLDECNDLDQDRFAYAAWCIRDRIAMALGVPDGES